jgi:hypothetical protein
MDLLNSKYDPYFIPSENEKYIILSTHRMNVENINQTKLSELNSKLHVFEGIISNVRGQQFAYRKSFVTEGGRTSYVCHK